MPLSAPSLRTNSPRSRRSALYRCVQRVQHPAEIGPLAVGFAVRIVVGDLLGEPDQDDVDVELVPQPIELVAAGGENSLQRRPAGLVIDLVLDGHARRPVGRDDAAWTAS